MTGRKNRPSEVKDALKWGVFNLVRVSNATTSCFLSDENDDHFKIIVIVIAKLHFWSLELQILTQGA